MHILPKIVPIPMFRECLELSNISSKKTWCVKLPTNVRIIQYNSKRHRTAHQTTSPMLRERHGLAAKKSIRSIVRAYVH